ncbi:hypothetical protein [Gorillibacterium massiliense]|uniref:hypothetical protein n=1 Tax=Gorillibacterium massiliense TaxID=1280390 RepID=UPI0004B1F32D|nr:hypothetical protein [Gorillibacterium massiliense]
MKKRWLVCLSIAAALILCLSAGYGLHGFPNPSHALESIVAPKIDKLSEQFWNVDLIIRGKVLAQGDSYTQDTGVMIKMPAAIEITPATFEIEDVIYGPDPGKTITYLQHGNTHDPTIPRDRFVHPQEEVILILNRTPQGAFWSYNFDDGIWIVKDGKLQSSTTLDELPKYNNTDADGNSPFIMEIARAAKYKHRESRFK